MREKLIQLGYKCDGSLEDYKKFFNVPEWFGIHWEQLAEENHTLANGDINVFYKWCIDYNIVEPDPIINNDPLIQME